MTVIVTPSSASVDQTFVLVPTRRAQAFGIMAVVEPTQTIPSVASLVWRFLFTGLLVLTGIVLATGQISRTLGEEQARSEARQVAQLTGFGIVQPQLGLALLDEDPDALDAMNDIVRNSVLSGALVRVKLWSADGRVIYSDESRLIGESFTLTGARAEALERSTVVTDISDPSESANRFERGGDGLLEVNVPLSGPDDTAVLYQAYFQLDGVRAAGREAWLAFAPVAIGALLVLQLVQVPIAWSMARRIRREALQSERRLQQALTASDVERRRISTDLHDGVVQDLTGVSYQLSALARTTDEGHVEDAARQIRAAVQQLRSLLVDIYPPDLEGGGLAPALEDLLTKHEALGLQVSLDVPESLELPDATAAFMYRIAQEALRNVATHAKATRVDVRIQQDAEGLVMTVEDDGDGFDISPLLDDGAPSAVADPRHFGLRILRDSAAELGGRLTLRSAPGSGTEIELVIPE